MTQSKPKDMEDRPTGREDEWDKAAIELAMHDAAECGDCPCPKEFGGPGYCEVLHAKALDVMRRAVEAMREPKGEAQVAGLLALVEEERKVIEWLKARRSPDDTDPHYEIFMARRGNESNRIFNAVLDAALGLAQRTSGEPK